MAKDKGKKSKDEKPTKGGKGKGGGDDFAKPSEAPASSDGWRFEHDDNLGKLFLIAPLDTKDVEGFEGKDAEVIVADIVEIDERKPAKSTEHKGAYVWGGWTKGSLRGFIDSGQLVLARLAQDKSKGRGKNAAWVLEDADSDDAAAAREYLSTIDPFVKAGDKGEKKKPKKGKK